MSTDMQKWISKAWMQSRGGSAIQLAPGKIDVSELSIEEVAHSLARIARFTGHTHGDRIYSVAQHSVFVSDHLDEPLRYAGLMHDAHECIIGDITTPVKMALRVYGGGRAFEQLDEAAEAAFRERFHVSDHDPTSVRIADLRACATERRDLIGPEAKPWNLGVVAYVDKIVPWTIKHAERMFLERFEELAPESVRVPDRTQTGRSRS